MWGIIGGSGFEKFHQVKVIEEIEVETPFGQHSKGLARLEINGDECIFLPRHDKNHSLLPDEVNYQANIFALKKLGCKQIVAKSAVGSLREDLKPGDMVIPSQYINRTHGRKSTFLGSGICGHVSLAHPTCAHFTDTARKLAESMDFQTHFDKTYICMQGPAFSTKAESNMYRILGADIVGMTNFPEYALAREAGMGYLPVCFVTDFDCWKETEAHVTVEQVLAILRQNNSKGFTFLEKLIEMKAPDSVLIQYKEESVRNGLLTDITSLPAEKQDWLKVLQT